MQINLKNDKIQKKKRKIQKQEKKEQLKIIGLNE